MKMMNMRLKMVIRVARITTCMCPCVLERSIMYVPRAGLITRLAAKVADTWGRKRERERGGGGVEIGMVKPQCRTDHQAGCKDAA